MNSELVKTLVSQFTNSNQEEVNILDWQFSRCGLLEFKMEDEDGCVRIYQMEIECRGYAKSLNEGNFEVIETD